MDIAAGIVARERARGRVTTIAVDSMKFIRPVRVGDILCVYANVGRVGTSSMAINIEAWAVRQMHSHEMEKVTEATFTFVAIDEAGQPRPVDG